ncbi:hypothetical protein [uncultured Alistipes sp.]|nr:hypothetical protein [uncultured Alistipes sp.]
MKKYIKLILRFQDANGDTILKAIRESAPPLGWDRTAIRPAL